MNSVEKEDFQDYLSICAIIKDEGPYLDEWLKYHQLMGVERFFIYDNESTDNTKQKLKPFIKKGVVDYTYWSENPAQITAYNECIKKNKENSFWIGFIDLDEFVVPISNPNIPEILKDFEGFSGLGVNWMIYGNSGYKRKPGGLQIEKYLYRAEDDFPDNMHVKLFLNPRKVEKIKVHKAWYKDGFTVNENKEKITGNRSEYLSVDKIRINHYFTRSTQECRKKFSRGDVNVKSVFHPWEHFEYFNRNEVYDPILRKYRFQIKI